MRRAVLAFGLLLAACSRGGGGVSVRLDGSPRRPTDEGVVTAVSRTSLTLDGARTYKVSKALKSFSTYTLETTPLLARDHQYVQVGARGKTVYWIAGIAAVVNGSVYYTGRLERVDGPDAVMRDGTVLRLAPPVRASARPGEVVARIDPKAHAVVELRSP